MKKWILYSDGASRGNPGESGAGVLLINPQGKEYSLTRYLGIKTNNQAEYEALLLGLRELVQKGGKEAEIRSDSELLIRQLKGEYRVRHENLIPLFQSAQSLLRQLKKVALVHVPREKNKRADQLSNDAIDNKQTEE